jgi:hypothetical protein
MQLYPSFDAAAKPFIIQMTFVFLFRFHGLILGVVHYNDHAQAKWSRKFAIFITLVWT